MALQGDPVDGRLYGGIEQLHDQPQQADGDQDRALGAADRQPEGQRYQNDIEQDELAKRSFAQKGGAGRRRNSLQR